MPLLLFILAVVVVLFILLLLRLFVIDKIRIDDIDDKAILITGSAGGFGRSFMLKCLENNMTVFAACRTKESAEKLRNECVGLKGHLDVFEMDISSDESVTIAKQYVIEQLNKLNKREYIFIFEKKIGVKVGQQTLREQKIFSAEKLRNECVGLKGHLDVFEMDISSDESVTIAKQYVIEQLNKLNKQLYAIVNNAGIQAEFLYDDFLELNDYKEAINVNAYGAIRVTKAFKNLVKKSRGRIVFCTSCICRFPAPGMGAYSTSKWALTGYLEVIRHELRDYGVDVISVEPGIYCTPLNAIEKTMKAMNATWARASNELREEYGEYWFSRGKRFFINVHDASPTDVTPVIDAYFHAITAKYPYKNYVVGLDAILLFQPFSWLPARLQELLMGLLKWLSRAPKPAAVDRCRN
uniref:Epimerase domain-containing protein n=1 Tax=Ascaris lumbricoides TaxID=6252 RepID=A0A0M3IQA0_ASCLU